jgi:hypothetical protein
VMEPVHYHDWTVLQLREKAAETVELPRGYLSKARLISLITKDS